MALLSRAQIDGADDRKWEDIPVAEWGGTVRLLGLSGTARNAYEASLVALGPNGSVQRVRLENATSKLVAMCLVDENFERLYTDKEVTELGKRNGAVLQRLHQVAQRLSGLGKKELEAATGNSEPEVSGSSTSD
ncbi:hypothetical protein [Streptomyces fuscichromogenes]|uniref:Tail assembly chaperone n=1 Tax=Streptomyces fuscichromogenes TaxID=1324013 RepID=A0A917XPH3_9ACTN|nr:hypothetical protein [Streptomyces fuscichromogenes]GGN46791.1 hypothetical protein GCM10011578_099930 [Streptomyces fuscichromogenes]